jgi:hypothetical protein
MVVILHDKLKMLVLKIIKKKEKIFVKYECYILISLFEEENKDTPLHL